MKIKGDDDKLGRRINKLAKKMEKYQMKKAAVAGEFWRGRKIVSFDEWRNILYTRRSQVFNYIPSEYVPGIVKYFPNDNSETVYRWNFDYLTFLASKRNPKLGADLCGKCILSGAEKNYDSMGIKKVVFKNLQKDALLHDRNPESKVRLAHPCPVENLFECPYQKEEFWHESRLRTIGHLVSLVCDAIHYAHQLVYNNDKAFYVNFDTGGVRYIYRYGVEQYGSIRTELEDVKVSKVYVRTADDVHRILTDEQMLRKVLDQYPAANENLEVKELTMKLFTYELKGRFNLEELRDPVGRSPEESRRTYEWLDEKYPDFPDNYNSLCSICSDHWAVIRCTLCDIAICPSHWRQHKQEAHAKTKSG